MHKSFSRFHFSFLLNQPLPPSLCLQPFLYKIKKNRKNIRFWVTQQMNNVYQNSEMVLIKSV